MNFGKLQEVNLRELWHNEERDFTPWLIKDENINYINEILGLTLVDVKREVQVGPYECDIVAKDEISGATVVIENQIEKSNHEHLGKAITYASGLDAKVVVWIVKEATEEHRGAIEWLNNKTDSSVGFFLLEIHAYKIGDSDPAPKFEIIEQPNDFVKNLKNNSGSAELNKSQSERQMFWERLNEVLVERNKPFNIRKASTDHWYDVSVGSSDCHVSITLVNKEHMMGVELYINEKKDLFDKLFEHKDEIENKLGFGCEWNRMDDKKSSRIIHYFEGLNFEDHSNYDELINEAITKAVKMRDVFKKYI